MRAFAVRLHKLPQGDSGRFPDNGVVIAGSADECFCEKLTEAMSYHRFWQRFEK